MSNFQELNFRSVYGGTSGPNALTDFLIPALGSAVTYDRVAGYFSSAVLAQTAPGVTKLVLEGGKIRLVTSHSLTQRDLEALATDKEGSARLDALANEFENAITNGGESIAARMTSKYVQAMCWLLKHGQLEIRLVVPLSSTANEMEKFHSKFGILTDSLGQKLVFAGSTNETWLAWTKNIENISVYKSWTPELEDHCNAYVETFNDLWEGKNLSEWQTIDLPSALKARLTSFAPDGDFPQILPKELNTLVSESGIRAPRNYQQEAVRAWEKAGRRGLLEMATGTGKTFTAKLCIDSAISQGTLLTVVVAPYQHIADQWAQELKEYNPLQLGVRGNWRQELQKMIFEASFGLRENLVLVVVKNTAATPAFLEYCDDLKTHFDNFLFVGDEVHWLGATSLQASLNPNANFRLGLSATPNRYFDDIGTDVLRDYFGKESVYVFDLAKALSWVNPDTGEIGVLCPYEYHPIFVSLTPQEEEDFVEISKKIAQKSAKEDKSKEDYEEIERLLNLRAEIPKKAENKVPAYEELVKNLGTDLNQTLVYCADFQQMDEALSAARRQGLETASRITGLEGSSKSEYFNGLSQREHILKNFAAGNHEVLYAIDCLDEGVDIPSARLGIILASSGNPKEFVQRRGRLMRKSRGKDRATIFDFIALPSDGTGPDSLRRIEISRIKEFSALAINSKEISEIISRLGD